LQQQEQIKQQQIKQQQLQHQQQLKQLQQQNELQLQLQARQQVPIQAYAFTSNPTTMHYPYVFASAVTPQSLPQSQSQKRGMDQLKSQQIGSHTEHQQQQQYSSSSERMIILQQQQQQLLLQQQQQVLQQSRSLEIQQIKQQQQRRKTQGKHVSYTEELVYIRVEIMLAFTTELLDFDIL
jgi:hypothetical protein